VDGATVSAEVLRQERGAKVVVFKYKPKARTRVKQGHRAELTTLRIADIAFSGKSAAKAAQQAQSRKGKAQKEAEQAAEEKAAADRELAAKLAEAASAAPRRATRRTRQADAAATDVPPVDGAPADTAPETPPTARSSRSRPAPAGVEAPAGRGEDTRENGEGATQAVGTAGAAGTPSEPASEEADLAADDDTRKDG
jgi:hypothetical protein